MSEAEMVDLTRVKVEKDQDAKKSKKEKPVSSPQVVQDNKTAKEPSASGVTVVQRIPAYLSKDFAGKLFLVQQPLKPATISLESQNITKVKYKPKLKKFQFTVGVDTKSDFYDKNKGESMAANTANTSGDEMVDLTDERPKIDSVTLEGSAVPLPSGSSRYVIGIVQKDQIHLCPLEGIIQIKPTFPYLNKVVEDPKKNADAGADTETEEEEEATKVTVKFTRNNRDPNAKDDPRRPKSFSVVKKLDEEEPWITKDYVDYRPSNVQKLYSKNITNELSYYPVNQKEYLEQLFPKFDTNYEGTIDKKKMSSGRFSITQLKQMTLADQVRVLMINGKVLRYSIIEEFLRTKLKVTVDDTSLLRTIQTVATLVQGCWVVRSDVLYSVDAVSLSNKNSQTVLQQARDLILSKFIENRIHERKKLCTLTHLPVEQVTEILTPIARKVPKKGWEFLLKFDSDFTSKYPDVVQRQTLMWEMKNQQKTRHPSTSDTKEGTTRAAGGRSRTKSISSDTDSGAESTEGRTGRRGGRQRRLSSRSDAGIPTPRVEP